MRTTRRTAYVASALAVLAMGAALVTARPAAAGPVPEDAIRRIREAVPKRATVRPKRPRKLLVFNLCRGFKHKSIPFGAKAFEIMGRRTGAYEAVSSEDISMFQPEKLRRFDAVLMNNTTGTLFKDEAMRGALLEFVKGGKGIVGIHAATDCFYDWREYGEMMGGYFSGHPWHEKVGIKLDDPGHPLLAAFAGHGFEITDEIYQFKDPYSREVLRVLLSIDVEKTNMDKKAIKREDKDFAVSWVRSYGEGRVFYCSLGHRNEIFWNPQVLQHYLDGIQFAFGDLEADTMPIGAPLGPGFRPLFNGKDLTGWKARRRSWVVQDGTLVRRSSGHIWTEDEFGDFVLDLEFKVARGANSGVLLRAADPSDPAQAGIEIQIADSPSRSKPRRSSCGAVYDCLAPTKMAAKKPGEWNRMVITCRGGRIEVVLNGSQVVDMDLDRWTKPRRNPDGSYNKYRKALKDYPRSGQIGLQSSSGRVWFRNIRIKGSAGGSELRKVDRFMGEYAGKLRAGGRSVEAKAQVVAQGDGSYKVVFIVEGARAARFELSGRVVGAGGGEKVSFSGNAEGARWTGELANDRLVASSKGGRFDLAYAPRRSPTLGKKPPPGAIVLLPEGSGPPSLEAWTNQGWLSLPDGSMQVGKGDNRTRRGLGDMQLHLEFMTPYMPNARGQGRGNSGVYIQDRYEVQVLDSFGLVSKDNDCGGIYKVAAPKVNACLPPLTWQSYDITFRAAKLAPGGGVAKPVEITVVHNGITIHDRQAVPHSTGGAARRKAVAKAPLRLQDHGNPVRYRNIWVVELDRQGPRLRRPQPRR